MTIEQDNLLKAAEDLLAQIEMMPSGYDYRPYYRLRPSSQLNDPDACVIRLREAIEAAGGTSARKSWERSRQ